MVVVQSQANFRGLCGRGTCPTGRSGLPADLMHVWHLEKHLGGLVKRPAPHPVIGVPPFPPFFHEP
jgi:hypothetical protein